MGKRASFLFFGTCIAGVCIAQTTSNVGFDRNLSSTWNWAVSTDSNFSAFNEYLSKVVSPPKDLSIVDNPTSGGSVACGLPCIVGAGNLADGLVGGQKIGQ